MFAWAGKDANKQQDVAEFLQKLLDEAEKSDKYAVQKLFMGMQTIQSTWDEGKFAKLLENDPFYSIRVSIANCDNGW